MGARALGHRSILADPRRADTHRRVNDVKRREQFRPLAPSCLAEHASDWFEHLSPNASPYMSITASAKPEKRTQVARGVAGRLTRPPHAPLTAPCVRYSSATHLLLVRYLSSTRPL